MIALVSDGTVVVTFVRLTHVIAVDSAPVIGIADGGVIMVTIVASPLNVYGRLHK